jgi:type I restriction enzyme S subunit
MKAYSQYIETSERWLPVIPGTWKMQKMKRLFKERSQKGFPDEPLLAATQSKGVVPKSLYGKTTVAVTKNFDKLKLVRVGDFVISLRSFQGGLECAHYQGIISAAYTILTPTGELTTQYFRYLAKCKPFVGLCSICVTGIREGQNVDYSVMGRHLLPIPPREEQDQIVRFLDWKVSEVNHFIREKRQEIKRLQELRRTIISNAVTKGGDGWITYPLRHLIFRTTDKNHPELDLLSVVREQGVIPRSYDRNENHNAIPSDLSGYQKVALGQFVINKMKAWQGSCGVSEYEGIVSPAYFVFNLRFENKRFFNYAIRSLHYTNQFARFSDGIRSGQWDLSIQKLRDIQFLQPPDDEQQAIVEYLDKQCVRIQAMIAAIKSEIALITEYRTRMISDVVTGKVDVWDIVIPDFDAEEAVEDEEDNGEAEEAVDEEVSEDVDE